MSWAKLGPHSFGATDHQARVISMRTQTNVPLAQSLLPESPVSLSSQWLLPQSPSGISLHSRPASPTGFSYFQSGHSTRPLLQTVLNKQLHQGRRPMSPALVNSVKGEHQHPSASSGLFAVLKDLIHTRKWDNPRDNGNKEAVKLLDDLLKMDPRVIASQLKHSPDAENFFEFLIHLLDRGILPDCTRRKARQIVLTQESVVTRLPNALAIKPENITMENYHSIVDGNFANVYMGKQGGNLVIMKRISQSQMDDEFRKEALAWRTISHPHVLPFKGVYSIPAQSFIALVSPFVGNRTLSDWRKNNKLTVSEIEKYVIQVADGLRYLHGEGIVHRDLISSNILLSNDNRAVICNFSLLLHSESTAARDPAASFQSTAPELLSDEGEGESVPTTKSDVYAFGCFYYEIHFGALPFGRKSIYSVCMKVMKGIRPARLQFPPLPDRAWKLIESCWTHDPAKRPTMDEVTRVLASWR